MQLRRILRARRRYARREEEWRDYDVRLEKEPEARRHFNAAGEEG